MNILPKPVHLGIALVALLAVSCRTGQAPEAPTLDARNYTRTVRIACVGDSITYGSGVAGRETNSYPAVLGQLLGPAFETQNFGVSGATLLKKGDKPYWTLPALREVLDYQPDAIVLKLGTNDTKPQNWQHGAEFAGDLRELITVFRALPSRPLLWLCLPVPVLETRWGINQATLKDEIIPALERVAEEYQLPVIDLYDALSEHPEMFPDKIHPNVEGARVMAEVVAAALTGDNYTKLLPRSGSVR